MPELLQDYVSRQAELRPNAIAVTLGGSSLTYGELDSASSRLAWHLLNAGCRRGDRICLLLPKSPAAVIAMLGVLKTDAVYVPIDLTSPPRLAPMIRISEPWGALVSSEAVKLLDDILEEIGDCPMMIGSIERYRLNGRKFTTCFDMTEVDTYPSVPPEAENNGLDIAHILFTSGSTGVPKGVVITHRNVIAFVEWARSYFGIEPGDRISGHTPLHFDLSMFDLRHAFGGSRAAHSPARAQFVTPQARRIHPLGRVDPMVFGPVGTEPYGQARHRDAERLSHAQTDVVVRRGIAHSDPHPFHAATAACPVHQSLRSDRNDHSEQLLHRT